MACKKFSYGSVNEFPVHLYPNAISILHDNLNVIIIFVLRIEAYFSDQNGTKLWSLTSLQHGWLEYFTGAIRQLDFSPHEPQHFIPRSLHIRRGLKIYHPGTVQYNILCWTIRKRTGDLHPYTIQNSSRKIRGKHLHSELVHCGSCVYFYNAAILLRYLH